MRILRALFVLALAASPLAAQSPASTTVIVVRHAEKAAAPAADPPLTAAGVARAEALVGVVRDAGVSVIISTQFARTRATAAPAAALLRLAPEIVDARAPNHEQLVAEGVLARHRGETVLVVGHSNTVPGIVAALGAPRPAPICDAEYDNVYVVVVPPRGPATATHARYGAASAVDASCREMK
jgi:broad specificity phosphatase PhoE